MTAVTTTKWVYLFSEGSAEMRDLLGGKGAGVAEMARIGIPVPPGFTVTTEACRAYYQNPEHRFPEGMWEQVLAGMRTIESSLGRALGDARRPLLVSVRAGAKFSMPGMMDTILNIGLNDETVGGLSRETGGDMRFALDAYRRLIQMFGKTAKGVSGELFEQALSHARQQAGVKSDSELNAPQLEKLVERFLEIYERAAGEQFPQAPETQLRAAVEAVFGSWNSDRAIAYRHHEGIADDLGTAVNVQAMVFGNLGDDSGTGVAFTRDPNTGRRELYGDYLPNAQGEDVVAGIRSTQPISALAQLSPGAWNELVATATKLEEHYRDIQDVEFTIEKGRLWMLQTRSAKRTGEAAVNAAVDMAGEGLITREEAVMRVEPGHLEQLLHPRIDPNAGAVPLATGVPAAPGAASGVAVFDPDTAEEWGKAGKAVILVRVATSPDDVHGMIYARGVLTSTGGTLSHAAVVARGMGRPCIVGASDVAVDLRRRSLTASGRTIHQGEEITIDGTTGAVYAGSVKTVPPNASPKLQTLLGWADGFRRLEVWANADYPRDAHTAVANGAQGVGLCRTEHMFMEEDRLPIVQAMILARTVGERERELARLLPIQREDFRGIFREMGGRPVVIRLIDPPLHEFLPHYEDLLAETVELRVTGKKPRRLKQLESLLERVGELREANPMMGLRGCRLGILFPEITRMQVRAIMEAACEVRLEGVDVHPEIMVPLVGTGAELRVERADLEPVADAVQAETGVQIDHRLGTMIELPRAALVAGEIARDAEFFSFGTNDLTQMTFGYSRDDAERAFLVKYLERGILPSNPFDTLDPAVVRLMRLAVAEGRQARPDLVVGICGEHGGDPKSIRYCHELGLDYVSCSPFRVPVARLAAAHAAMESSSTTA
jgi:pyruvate,orthophosphate dikinase